MPPPPPQYVRLGDSDLEALFSGLEFKKPPQLEGLVPHGVRLSYQDLRAPRWEDSLWLVLTNAGERKLVFHSDRSGLSDVHGSFEIYECPEGTLAIQVWNFHWKGQQGVSLHGGRCVFFFGYHCQIPARQGGIVAYHFRGYHCGRQPEEPTVAACAFLNPSVDRPVQPATQPWVPSAPPPYEFTYVQPLTG